MLCLTLATLCCAQSADVVYIIDQSVGMGPEQNWIQNNAVWVDTQLIIGGVPDTRYALVGFGAIDPEPQTFPIAGSDFGSAAALAITADQLATTGTTEDGYAAINHALFTLPFRNNVPIAIVLFTDEDRDVISGFGFQSTLDNLAAGGAVLHVVVDATYQQNDGTPATGLDRRRRAYLADGTGGVDIGASGFVAAAFGTTGPDYIALADQSGGATLDINADRAGGTTQESFTAALVDALLMQLNPPLCTADVTTAGAFVGDPGYGQPDGAVTGADLNYFVNLWIAGDLEADITTQGAPLSDPDYGVPDGLVTAADLLFFIEAWLEGCPW